MKRQKYVKVVLAEQYSVIPTSVQSISLDNDGLYTYLNENGDIVSASALDEVTGTTLVDSDTTSITGETSVTIAATGDTYQIEVENEDAQDVTFECTFVSGTPATATVSATGLVTAVASGSTIITITHADGPTGTLTVTVS